MNHGSRPSLLLPLLLCLGSFGSDASAGVTGVPGINDYTVNGCASGSTSCGSCIFTSPLILNFTVSTAPNTPVFFAFVPQCPCTPDSFYLAPVTCLLPFGSFTATTNQSIDLNLTCPIISCLAISNAAGFATCSFNIPLLTTPLVVSTQAAVIGLPCGLPSPWVATQAYRVTVL